MRGYLRKNVQLGAKVTGKPEGLSEMLTGIVVSIPSHRRFAVVEFTFTPAQTRRLSLCSILAPPRAETFREAVLIMPPENKIMRR